MKVYRIGINKICLEMTDSESEDISMLINRGLDDLDEYNELNRLKEHKEDFYKNVLIELGLIRNYE